MDGLSFSAALLTSLIWPLFLGGLLVLFRTPLKRMIDGLGSASSRQPWRLVFQSQLQSARVAARSLPWRPKPEVARAQSERPSSGTLRAGHGGEEGTRASAGEAAVEAAWVEASRACGEAYRKRVHLPDAPSLDTIILSLHSKGRVETPVLLLFWHLQGARDAASHETPVSAAEAQDFKDLLDQLERAVLTSVDLLLPAANGTRPGDATTLPPLSNGPFRTAIRAE